MLAAEGERVIIPVQQENRFFPWRKETVSSVHLWGGDRQWEDKWWKVPKISFGADSNKLTDELGDGCAAWHVCGQRGLVAAAALLSPEPLLGVPGDWSQYWGVLVTHQFMGCSSTPWHKANCPGDLLPISDPNDKPNVDIPGYSTCLSEIHSCDGWCSAALQPPNHTVRDPALRRKRKQKFCFNQHPRKYYLLYFLGALVDPWSCNPPDIHICREDNYWLITWSHFSWSLVSCAIRFSTQNQNLTSISNLLPSANFHHGKLCHWFY